MSTEQSTGEVENIIQSPEITSTTRIRPSNQTQTLTQIPTQNPRTEFPRRRRPLHPECNNMINSVNPAIPTNPINRKSGSTRFALLSVGLIFTLSLSALFYVWLSFPELEEDEKQHIQIPWDIEGAKKLGVVLDRYKDKYFFEVLSGVCVTYIFLQTFAIPGSLFLSILSGFLFPFMYALMLVCCCSAIGASLCYSLSQLLGRRLVKKFFPERAEKWACTVHKHRDHIFNYILFLRMTPFLPNWFINLVAPVIGVPLVPFALGTFIGVGPPSFVAIQAGQTLYKMSSSNDAFSWSSVVLLSVFALLSLVPVVLKRRLREKFD